jgi:hypothetical protein
MAEVLGSFSKSDSKDIVLLAYSDFWIEGLKSNILGYFDARKRRHYGVWKRWD